MAGLPLSRLVFGKVMHRRYLPVGNRFVYPVFFVLINLDELKQLDSTLFGVNRRAPLSFHYSDYGDGGDPNKWVRQLLERADVEGCDGPIWLQTFPRLLGYLFNPVSFWYCTRADGSVGAIIAEVNNTFGEKHCYLLLPNDRGEFKEVTAEKALYVSPFYPVEGHYSFHFNTADFEHPRVSIRYFNRDQLQLNTAIWGSAEPLTNRQIFKAILRQPLLTFGVMLRIHWQALRLWVKGVPFITRPSTSLKESS